MTGPKILTIDIETSPAKVWSFQMWNANISPGQIIEPTRMISFAAKWHGEKTVLFRSEYHNSPATMVAAAWALLNQADVVVTYNGDKFDIPHLNREFDLLGLTPPSPYTSVDLYKVVKKNQVWLSHKLGYITEQLALTGKLSHSGFQLWRDCLEGDEAAQRKAWNTMRRYNKQDVVTTEELYDHMLPLVKNLPAAGLYAEDGVSCCPNCGSEEYQHRGHFYTKTRRYPRMSCNECGKWFRGTRSDKAVTEA